MITAVGEDVIVGLLHVNKSMYNDSKHWLRSRLFCITFCLVIILSDSNMLSIVANSVAIFENLSSAIVHFLQQKSRTRTNVSMTKKQEN
ncbi:hypothetical protein Scep_028256 [Stephania cephalantha]|uniref:Uncharacterized protein n=1 Tax=Stephania cephalantha TaxID=152367 RepID=A0AAP0HJD5_9MAGN